MTEEINESATFAPFRRLDLYSLEHDAQYEADKGKVEIEFKSGRTVTFVGTVSAAAAVHSVLRDLWSVGELIEPKTSEPETPAWLKPIEERLSRPWPGEQSQIEVLTDRISALARRVCELENLNHYLNVAAASTSETPSASENQVKRGFKPLFGDDIPLESQGP